MLNDILTLDQQWFPNQSDFPPISWPWYRLWPSPNYEWFPWSISNGCGMPAGNAYPSGHLVPSPFWDLLMLQLLRPNSSNLPCLYSTFSSRIPLGTFSILLKNATPKCKIWTYTIYSWFAMKLPLRILFFLKLTSLICCVKKSVDFHSMSHTYIYIRFGYNILPMFDDRRRLNLECVYLEFTFKSKVLLARFLLIYF